MLPYTLAQTNMSVLNPIIPWTSNQILKWYPVMKPQVLHSQYKSITKS
jgi:hypothetical protein